MLKKWISICLIIVLTLLGCDHQSASDKLAAIDSLVVHEQYDSAFASVLRINSSELTEREDSAHYYLLLVQTSMLTQHPDTLNMLDSLVIPFYNNIGNHEKLAEAYYYKAYRVLVERDYPKAILWFKKAEEQAFLTNKLRLHYKIFENLSYINGVLGNHILQLDYALKALKIAKATFNKEWIAYAYCRISFAYSILQNKDSAVMYINKAIPYSRYIKKEDQPTFLTNAAYVYKYTLPDTAKKYLIESLAQEESSVTMQHLADIYYHEGNEDESYRLLKKALTVNDGVPKDNILHNILDYDMDHGHTDHVCETVNEILHIKDSILNSLRNDTIKDLQLRFDHEVALNAANERLIRWQRYMGIAVFIGLVLAGLWLHKRHMMKMMLDKRQIEMYKLINLLDGKKSDVQNYENQIAGLRTEQQKGSLSLADLETRIEELTRQKEEAENDYRTLSQRIRIWAGAETDKVRQGALLMDEIEKNMCVKLWPDEKIEAFVAYYCAIHTDLAKQIYREHRKLTARRSLYLVLVDMKKTIEEMSTIMGIDKNSLRSYRFQIKKKEIEC